MLYHLPLTFFFAISGNLDAEGAKNRKAREAELFCSLTQVYFYTRWRGYG